MQASQKNAGNSIPDETKNKIKSLSAQIQDLNKRKLVAVEQEDYAIASSLKKQIESLQTERRALLDKYNISEDEQDSFGESLEQGDSYESVLGAEKPSLNGIMMN
jgi:hypothetical protein